MNHRRHSFQNESWYLKHRSPQNPPNRISTWLASHSLTTLKKASILSSSPTPTPLHPPLSKPQLLSLLKHLSKTSPKQRPGIDRKLIKFTITSLKFHFENKEFMGFISRDLVWKGVKKDTVLVKEGGKYEGLYLLLEGKCEVVGRQKRWVVSGEGVFGEKELWEERVSEEMVKCKTDCEFLVVAREEFQKEKRRVEVEANENILCVLKKIPLFRCFAEPELLLISKQAQIINLVEKGNLITQGHKHPYFYIIIEGVFQGTQSTTPAYNTQGKEKVLWTFETFDVVNLEGIYDKVPLMSVRNKTEGSELYRFSVAGLQGVFRGAPKIFKEIVMLRLEMYKKVGTPRQSPEKYPRNPLFRSDTHLKTNPLPFFLSELPDHPPSSSDLFLPPPLPSQLKSKINLFTKARKVTRSSDRGSGSIRSKPSKLIDLSNLHENIEVDSTRGNSFLLSAYKEKIESTGGVELDVQNRLYRDGAGGKEGRRWVVEELGKTMRMGMGMGMGMGETVGEWRGMHQKNRSVGERRVRTGEGSRERERGGKEEEMERRRDTEMLLKRVQMSSCRKKRNRIKVMFNPKDIVDFNQTEEERGVEGD